MHLRNSKWFPSGNRKMFERRQRFPEKIDIAQTFQQYVGKGKWRFMKFWLILSALYIHYALMANFAYLIQTNREGAIYILAGYILSQIGQMVALNILFFRRKQVQSLLVKLFVTLDSSDPLVLLRLFRKTRFLVISALIFGTTLAVVGTMDIMDKSTDSQYILSADNYCFSCESSKLTMLQSRLLTIVAFTLYSYCVIGCGILIASFYAFVCMAIVNIAKRLNSDLVTFQALHKVGTFLAELRSRLYRLNVLIEEANWILQDIVLIWYVITLLHTCYGVTEAIKRAGSTTLLSFIYHVILNCGDLFTLMTVTYYASKIPEVLAESFDFVPILAEHAIVAGYQVEINLLYQQLSTLKTGIRLGGCYVITKNLFFSFTGLAITYGVIYIQLNPDVLSKLQNFGNNSTCTCSCHVL